MIMNIFLTDYNPIVASQHLDDLRLNKMILETAQILSQAHRYFYGDNEKLYKDTHINHPCCVWAKKNEAHYSWLCDYFLSLCKEKEYRSGKTHLTFIKLFTTFRSKQKLYGLEDVIFDFDCSTYKDSTLSLTEKYQHTLVDKWNADKRTPKWTNRQKPYFYK